MKTTLFNYLRFSRAERIGTLFLIFATAVIFVVPEILHYQKKEKSSDFRHFQQEIAAFKSDVERNPDNALFLFDPNTASTEDFIRLGLSEKTATSICRYRDKGGKFKQAGDFQKIWNLRLEDFERLLPYIRIGLGQAADQPIMNQQKEPEGFAFDPNLASEEDFLRLGLPQRTAKGILNYRAKGGRFRKAADLEKIYTLSANDFKRIAPFIMFSAENQGDLPVLNREPRAGTPAGGLVDINRANVETWMSLPGIGEMRARQLVSFREKLGGFLSVEQVGEMRSLPDSIFQRIRSRLVFDASNVRKINLNTANPETLDAHPYISKKQAQLIVAYREQHGAFDSEGDLNKILALTDPVWLAKVRPYLSVRD